MAYTEDDAAAYRTRLLDPNGIFAKDPVKQDRLVKEHDANVAYWRDQGLLAPSTAEAYDPAKTFAQHNPTRAPVTAINEGFVELVNESLDRLDGATDQQLADMASSRQILAQVEGDQHYQASRRQYVHGAWQHMTPAQYLDALAEAAKPFIASFAEDRSDQAVILKRARTNLRILQSFAAMASRLPK